MSDQRSTPGSAATRKSVLRGTLAALLCAILGGALIAMGGAASALGVTMFLLLPAATGFVTALTVEYWRAVAASLLIAMSLCFAGLVFIGFEGIVCVVMASPILIVGAMVGAAVGTLAKRHFPVDGRFSMVVAPVLAGVSIFGAGRIEDRLDTGSRIENVESTVIIDASPDEVWDAIVEFDDVDGPKPLLMRMGLPVPQSCSMDGSGVGAVRICRFDSGFIRERVTRWEPPHRLDFDVEDVQLPGRHWLGFQRASYMLLNHGAGGTKVTRTTTVTSTLRPAVYWRVFEHLGTETEHSYILNSLDAAVSGGE